MQTPTKAVAEVSNLPGQGGIRPDSLGSTAGARLAAEVASERPLLSSFANGGANALVNGLNFEASLAAATGSALETVAAMRRGRPASPRLFSRELAAPFSNAGSRAGSTPGTARALGGGGIVKHAAQDSAILTAVRRQMEALEDKLSGQIGRVQQQSDRLRDAALTRVDSKMVTMEALQPKLDRRIAELSGNYKGLSDEMQAQIRRLDQMDSRLWEWRHQLEEEVRSKFVDIEQNYQRVSSSVRVMSATNEDLLKRHNQRVQRVEGILEERLQSTEEAHAGLMNLHERLEQVEQTRLQDLALVPVELESSRAIEAIGISSVDSASVMMVETRLSDACAKIDTIMEESRDAHARLEAQEERLKSLHTRVESREEHYRWLNDRVERTDWEGRFKEIKEKMQDFNQGRIQQSEDVQLLAKKLETSEQATEECTEQIRRFYMEKQLFAGGQETSPPRDASDFQAGTVGETLSLDMRECTGRIDELQARSDQLTSEVESMRSDVALAPRVAALLDQLKDVAPKVIEQESCVRDLLEKVGKLEVEDTMKKTMEQGKSESTSARIQRVEADVERLAVQMDMALTSVRAP